MSGGSRADASGATAAERRANGNGRGGPAATLSARVHSIDGRPADPANVAWLASIPCALLIAVAIALLGEPLGELLFAPDAVSFWPSLAPAIRPEPTELARYAIALTGPALLVGAIVMGVRSTVGWPAQRTTALLVTAMQAVWLVFLIVCLVAQRRFAFGEIYLPPDGESFHQSYFTSTTIVAAVVIAAAFLACLSDERIRTQLTQLVRETTTRRVVASVLAIVFIAVWLLHAIATDESIGVSDYSVLYHLQFTFDEALAVLDGRAPLVDFAAQYGSLIPYPVAGAMAVVGSSVGAFTTIMSLLTGLAMLAMFDVLRRVVRNSLTALALFLPFLATSFFLLHGSIDERYTFGNYFGAYPLRFAGPYLLLWLLARQLSGARPRSTWPVFLAAGLVVLNNAEYGIGALAATVAAVSWTGGLSERARRGRVALEMAGGLAAAVVLVIAFTLLWSGSLPDFTLLVRYAELFAGAGFAMLPMPTLGFHTVIYLTFVATVGAALVRALDGAADRLLTGMLAWVGVFGLGAGAYYVGRSHPEVLVASFSPWALAVVLLVVVVGRRLAAGGVRPTVVDVACLVAFGLTACSLVQTPTPWSQLDRLNAPSVSGPVFAVPAGQTFVADQTDGDEPVAVLVSLGHRLAFNVGVTDVTPYSGPQSIQTEEQLEDTLSALREAGGSKAFVNPQETAPELLAALQARGFALRATDPTGVQLWIDRR